MIYIFKGDSTTFADVEKFLTFYIQTRFDMTGWTAEFKLGSIVKTVDDISTGSFEIILSSQETSKLSYGFYNGVLKLTDSQGQIKTVSNTIPFKVVDTVIENENEIISLDIPTTAEVEINLEVGSSSGGGSENIVAGENINIEYSGGDLVVSAIVPTLISQLQNDLGYQTLADVMGIIASIPKFKLSIVNELPETGEKMVLYLVPKEEIKYDGTKYDAYGEYIWIEETANYEYLGSTAPDLTDYVKNTDYASVNKHGVVKFENAFGITADNNGRPFINRATNAEIDAKKSTYKPIVPASLDYAVNAVLPTMTQAEYDALETKNENLFYMIVEE